MRIESKGFDIQPPVLRVFEPARQVLGIFERRGRESILEPLSGKSLVLTRAATGETEPERSSFAVELKKVKEEEDMAVAVPAKQQVAELMENLKIDDRPESIDEPNFPAKDESTIEATAGVAPSSESAGAKENKPQLDAVEQRPFYPANYYHGFYYPGHEANAKEWDEQARYVGMDGLDMQYPGVAPENGSMVYYTPGYGYPPQTPYNPYNPYIPGAMVGSDGQFLGQRPYYTGPPYQHPVSSGYFQPPVHPSSQEPGSVGPGQANANSIAGSTVPHKLAEKDGKKGTVHAGGARSQNFRPMTQIQLNQQQGLGARGPMLPKDSMSFRKNFPGFNQGKVMMPFNNNNMVFKPNSRLRGKVYGNHTNENWNFDVLNEQNRGPRTNRPKGNQISSETRNSGGEDVVGNGEINGNVISREQYNPADFSIEYDDAKFFVIKSYSEDDVHQSIKYSVWASTPNGNKRLDGAYQETQKISGENNKGCPVFLFFSVNASGQFCGVAEMVGSVDFDKSMDFWQQDKWSGFFPVKWHMIKDIPNSQFRQIILENNDNKPVTNSRDTQEIKFQQGIEMLKIFKNYSLKTSILDDFTFYEGRQKVMKEKKLRQQAQQQQHLAVREGANVQKLGEDGNVVNSSDVKASGLRLPVTSENDNQHSDSNGTENAGLEHLDEKTEETVQSKGVESKKHDSEISHVDSPGVLIVGSVAC